MMNQSFAQQVTEPFPQERSASAQSGELTRQLSAAAYRSSALRRYIFDNIIYADPDRHEIMEASGIDLLTVVRHCRAAQKQINRLLAVRILLLILVPVAIVLAVLQVSVHQISNEQFLLICASWLIGGYLVVLATRIMEVWTAYKQMMALCFSEGLHVHSPATLPQDREVENQILDLEGSMVTFAHPASATWHLSNYGYHPFEVIITPLAALGWKLKNVFWPYGTIRFPRSKQSTDTLYKHFDLTEFYSFLTAEVRKHLEPDPAIKQFSAQERLYIAEKDRRESTPSEFLVVPPHGHNAQVLNERASIYQAVREKARIYMEHPTGNIRYYWCFRLVAHNDVTFTLCLCCWFTPASFEITQEGYLLGPAQDFLLVDTTSNPSWTAIPRILKNLLLSTPKSWLLAPREGISYFWLSISNEIKFVNKWVQRLHDRIFKVKLERGAKDSLRSAICYDPFNMTTSELDTCLAEIAMIERPASQLLEHTQEAILLFLDEHGIDTKAIRAKMSRTSTAIFPSKYVFNFNKNITQHGNGTINETNIKSDGDVNTNNFWSPGPHRHRPDQSGQPSDGADSGANPAGYYPYPGGYYPPSGPYPGGEHFPPPEVPGSSQPLPSNPPPGGPRPSQLPPSP